MYGFLRDLFHNNENFKSDKPCFIYYNSRVQHYITYKNILNSLSHMEMKTKRYFSNRFIGLVYNEMFPAIITVALGVIQQNSAFLFLDVNAGASMKETCKNVKISFIVLQQDSSTMVSYVNANFPSAKYLTEFAVLGITFEIWKCNPEINTDDSGVCNSKYAFAVCTSGSTGQPKIVKVTHNSLIPNILHLRDLYAITADDVFFTTAPLTFDPSIIDIFLALTSGASLLMLPKEIKIQPEEFFNRLFLTGPANVTILYTTPSLLRRWNDDVIGRLNSTTLRILSLGGEPCPSLEVINRWDIMRQIKIYNLYGITEISCWASVCCVNDVMRNNIPLGFPIKETVLQVRDQMGNVVLSDGLGEMFIGSKTRVCYVDDEQPPVNKADGICFRATGDIVEIEGSSYYFVGRKDRIVKLYGRQIDLSAIESSSLKSEKLTHCCCFHLEQENKIILIVKTCNDNNSEEENDRIVNMIKLTIAEEFSLILDDVVVVSEMPLNEHGKISERNCKLMYRSLSVRNVEKFRKNDAKELFYSLWRKYTMAEENDSDSSFIKFGNDSIRAIQFLSEYSQIHNSSVPSLSSEFMSALLGGKNAEYCYSVLENNNFSSSSSTLSPSSALSSSVASSSLTMDELRSSNKRPINDTFSKRKTNDTQSSTVIEAVGDHNENNLILWKCRGIERHLTPTVVKREFLSVSQNMSVFWKYNLNKCIDSSPLLMILNGNKMIVICGSHSGELIAMDVASGNIISKCTLPDRIESTACCSSNGSSIYVGCYDKNLYSVDVYSGKILWKFETADIIKCGPVVCDRCIYFGSYDHYLYRLTEEGALLWRMNIDGSSIYASVAIYETYAIAATLRGTVVTIDTNDNNVKCRYQFGRPVFSNPLPLQDLNAFCVADVSGVLYCCCVTIEMVLWKYQAGGNVFSSLAVVNRDKRDDEPMEIVFGCYDRNLYCVSISKQNARLKWKSDLGSPIYATPFVYHHHHHHRYVISATVCGLVFILNVDDGSVVSNFKADGGEIFSSPVVHENFILFGCRNDNLYCLKLTDCLNTE